jgi:hypothetical protein
MPAMLRILPLTLILFGSSGCQDPTPKWVGEYRGENKALVDDQLAKENPILAGQIRLVILDLKSDRTFILTRGGMPTQGNYTLSNDKATLTITKILDQPIEKQSDMVKKQNVPIHLTRNKDGSITLEDPGDFGRDPIILKPSSNKK